MSVFSISRTRLYVYLGLVAAFLSLVALKGAEHAFMIGQTKAHLSKIISLQEFGDIVRTSTAQSVVVYDLRKNRIVAEKQSRVSMSLASITKIFTSALAYQTVLESYGKNSDATKYFLHAIQGMMAASSNEEAEAVSRVFGETETARVQALNDYTKEYGLTFNNVTGLDLKDIQAVGGTGSAIDVARAIDDIYIKYPEIFDKTIIPYSENTNIIAGKLGLFLAGKTGFTNYSGGNLVVIIQKGLAHKYVIVVLGSTENGRFVDVETIAKALLQLDV